MIAQSILPLVFAICTFATTVNVDQTVTFDVGETDSQVIHHVSVGLKDSPIFIPNRLNANIGDQILFEFHNLNHTLTQSSLDKPCVPIGGFDTGFNEYNPQDRDNIVVSWTVNSLDPQWFFCRQDRPLSHCHAGMVFALNPGGQMGTFLRNARRDNGNLDHGPTSTEQLTSTHIEGEGTASPILSSPTPPLLGHGPVSVTPGSIFTSGSTSSSATPDSIFTSGSISTPRHSHASAAELVTPVVVTTVTRTVGCTATANTVKRSSSPAVFSSEGHISILSPLAPSFGLVLGLAVIIVMMM